MTSLPVRSPSGGASNNMNECYMKMNTVVYSIKQHFFMCFLLPVDSKPTADKMSVNKSKATFEIEFLWYCGGNFENGDR
jgi:hypothetical protein